MGGKDPVVLTGFPISSHVGLASSLRSKLCRVIRKVRPMRYRTDKLQPQARIDLDFGLGLTIDDKCAGSTISTAGTVFRRSN